MRATSTLCFTRLTGRRALHVGVSTGIGVFSVRAGSNRHTKQIPPPPSLLSRLQQSASSVSNCTQERVENPYASGTSYTQAPSPRISALQTFHPSPAVPSTRQSYSMRNPAPILEQEMFGRGSRYNGDTELALSEIDQQVDSQQASQRRSASAFSEPWGDGLGSSCKKVLHAIHENPTRLRCQIYWISNQGLPT
ncbi:uncharacterized protein LOC135372430 isoform X2 [Ornithodoros turicata]|uniref:uncharacterized protein LOC135372430 isoform X2 n=1 Tax=Ornithodoros turicata TaxID=34597 RepID=UPI003138DA35